MSSIEKGPVERGSRRGRRTATPRRWRASRAASTPWNATLRTTCVATHARGRTREERAAAARRGERQLPRAAGGRVDYVTATLKRVIADTAVTLTIDGTPHERPAVADARRSHERDRAADERAVAGRSGRPDDGDGRDRRLLSARRPGFRRTACRDSSTIATTSASTGATNDSRCSRSTRADVPLRAREAAVGRAGRIASKE